MLPNLSRLGLLPLDGGVNIGMDAEGSDAGSYSESDGETYPDEKSKDLRRELASAIRHAERLLSTDDNDVDVAPFLRYWENLLIETKDNPKLVGLSSELSDLISLIEEKYEFEPLLPTKRRRRDDFPNAQNASPDGGGGVAGGDNDEGLLQSDTQLLSHTELLSHTIDDMTQLSLDEAEGEAVTPGPGNATQIERMHLDDGPATRRSTQLQDLRGQVVELLRNVQNEGRMTGTMRSRAEDLHSLLRKWAHNPAARQMSGAVAELLRSEVADGGGPQAEPGPDASGEPRGARIVGRATDVLVDGSRRHSFLLFQPPRSYSWLTEEGMRAEPALLAILNAYPGPKGDDPSGNGFVVVVVRARGPAGRRQYRVQWTVEPQVPVKYAEAHDDGWLLRRQLVNPGMADAFDRRQRDEDASGDEDDDHMGAGGVEAESQDAGEGAGGPSALKWSPAQGRPLLSMRRAVAQHGGAHLGALWEYTASRLFALRCRVPPAPNMPGAPTEDELVQVGKDLYEVDRKALDAVFRRERAQEARERLLSADEDDADEDDADEEEALAAWRAEREAELRADAEARWSAVRVEDAPHTARLKAQLEAIEALEAAGGDAAAVSPTTAALLSDAAAAYVAAWAADRDDAAAQISQPRLRLPRIRDVLSQPSRSAVADGWLRLLRDVHSDTAPTERLASAYGPSWPQRPGPTATPPDHVVATRSLRMGAGLVIEHGDPAQNPANLALCTLSQNSAKSDSVLGLFSAPGEVQGAAGQDVYSPGGVSDAKKAMLAKAVAMVFALYWGARCRHALLCTHPLACGALVRSVPWRRLLCIPPRRRSQQQEAFRRHWRLLRAWHRH